MQYFIINNDIQVTSVKIQTKWLRQLKIVFKVLYILRTSATDVFQAPASCQEAFGF